MKKTSLWSRYKKAGRRLVTPAGLWWLAVGLFAAQATTLAFITKFGVPPDENNHISFIDYYTDHSLDPFFSDQPPTYNLGDKTREVDYLYHYVMSLVQRVLPFSQTAEHYIIRLCTVALAVLTLYVLRRVFRRLGLSDTVSTLFVLVASGFSMVLMMSSAVNNDVLVWLGVATGLLLSLRLWEKPRVLDLLWLVSLVSYAGLAKRTLLPIAAAFALVGIVAVICYWRQFWRELRRPTLVIVVAAVLALTGLGLSAERIGGNVLRYGNVAPSCNDVQGEAACHGFWWNMRERELARRAPEAAIPLQQFVNRWLHENLVNVLDIQTQAWRHEIKPARWVEPVWWIFITVGLCYGFIADVRRSRTDQTARQRLFVLAVVMAFMAALLLVNYSEYKRSAVFGLALNGRYMLAGFLPLLGLLVWYWSRLLPQRKIAVGLFVLLLAVTAWQSGFWLLLQNPQLIHG